MIEKDKTDNFIFEYDNLKEFILYMKGIAKIVSFNNWNGSGCKYIILRHDVDFDQAH